MSCFGFWIFGGKKEEERREEGRKKRGRRKVFLHTKGICVYYFNTIPVNCHSSLLKWLGLNTNHCDAHHLTPQLILRGQDL